MQARKIPFQDIRKEAKIKSKDLVRIKTDAFYEELSENEICAELKKTSGCPGNVGNALSVYAGLVNLTQKMKTEEDVEVEDQMRFMN